MRLDQYAKAISSGVMGALIAMGSILTTTGLTSLSDFDHGNWIAVVIAGLLASGVTYTIPNAPPIVAPPLDDTPLSEEEVQQVADVFTDDVLTEDDEALRG